MITLTFEGGAEMARNLDRMPSRVSRQIQIAALMEAGVPMRDRMAELAPVEPGKPDLRDTFSICPTKGQDERETAVAVGPTRAGFYGSFLELGTKFIAAHPFMRPGFDTTVQKSLAILSDELWFSIRRGGVDTF